MGHVFWSSFAQNVWAGLVVGLVLLLVTYLAVDRGLKLRERRAARLHLLRTILGEIQRELENNLEQAALVLKHAPKLELPFPLFDVNGWDYIRQTDVLTALNPQAIELLVKTYNRLRTANQQYAQVHDLLWGSTAISITTQAASVEQLQRFGEHSRQQLDHLVDRVRELIPAVQAALRAVESSERESVR